MHDYKAFFWNPSNAKVQDLGIVVPDGNGVWRIPLQTAFEDSVLVLDATRVCDTLLAEK